MLRDKTKLEQYSSLKRIEFPNTKTESRVLRNQHFLCYHLKGFQETIYFLRNITITIRTYIESLTNSTCVYNLNEVKFKFLGNKKGPTKGFYLKVWKIDSVFWCQVYLLNYHNCFYSICEGLYLRASHATA